MTTIHHLPKEILEIIADKLTSTKDLYTGLSVSRLWYACFSRSLYRHIRIYNRRQFRKFYSFLPYSSRLIRKISFGIEEESFFRSEDYINGSVPPSTIQIGVTLYELNTILTSFPLLDSFCFDSRLWSYLNVNNISKKDGLKSLPPLDHPRQFVLLTNNLTRLHLRGSDVFYLHETNQLLPVLDQTPMLTHLKMDGNGIWDTGYTVPFSIHDMEILHSKLPFLQDFEISDTMQLITTNDQHHSTLTVEPAFHLKHVQISATLQYDNENITSWFSYFTKKYTALSSLNLNIGPEASTGVMEMDHSISRALVTLIKSLHQLESISIHHDMGKLFIGNDFLLTLCKVPLLQDVQLGLSDIGLLHAPIPTLSKLVVSIYNNQQFNLLGYLDRLVDLTLSSCSKKTNGSKISYPMQSIFESCPHLVNLELNRGHLEGKISKNNRLKRLRMNGVTIRTARFFSRLLSLDTLFLRECVYDKEGPFLIDLSAIELETIVISELKVVKGSDKLTLLKKTTDNHMRWYKEIQHPQSFRFYLQRMHFLHTEECHVALTCQSVKSIFFNGCKI